MPESKESNYTCSECLRTDITRDDLKRKIVSYRAMGAYGVTAKTKTIAWLCTIPQPDGSPSCLEKDPEWNMKPYSNTPGSAA